MFDSFVGLVEPLEDMNPHRRAEHQRRRAAFVERQVFEQADAIAELMGPRDG
jgi:hypothetical protein